MYSLLIVDDEKISADAMAKLLDWPQLQIGSVYIAYSSTQAKEILVQFPVDIMLCDIEMPQGNGLDLFSWAKERSPGLQTIFLTCHADFNYAKSAIGLGCLDYLLKPAMPDELNISMEKAIGNIERGKSLKEYGRYVEFWEKQQPVLIRQFFEDILNGVIPPEAELIKNTAAERNIPYDSMIRVIPILFGIQRWNGMPENASKKKSEKELRRMIEAGFFGNFASGQLLTRENNRYLYLLYSQFTDEDRQTMLKKSCEQIVEEIHTGLGCDISCYLGAPVTLDKIDVMAEGLSERDLSNVMFNNSVFLFDEHVGQSTTHEVPDMNNWMALLVRKCWKEAQQEIDAYLHRLEESREITPLFLRQFYQDFLQMIYSVLRQQGIQAHLLLTQNETDGFYERARNSVTDLLLWIDHMIRKLAESQKYLEKTDEIIEKVKGYVALNLGKDLTRNDIASQVYLSPNYLTRIFKEKTGVTIMEYIINERLNLAKQLLRASNLPISSVAEQVSYTNFSHFSLMFRKYTGMSPNDYRKSG